MKIQLNKIRQGPVLAKGSDSAGHECGMNGTNVGDGCLNAKGNLKPSATVTYSQPCSC
jgi:hypothetical protein